MGRIEELYENMMCVFFTHTILNHIDQVKFNGDCSPCNCGRLAGKLSLTNQLIHLSGLVSIRWKGRGSSAKFK